MAKKPTGPSPKIPAFYKVLVHDDFSQYLCLPPSFIKHFTRQLPCTCSLRGPSGVWWTVELEESEDTQDRLFFHTGWQHFVEDHGLEIGNFLVFEYDGGSKFDVTIYDPTGSEKEVEVARMRSGNQARVHDEIIDLVTEDSDENYGEMATTSQKRKRCDSVKYGKRRATASVKETSNGTILFKAKNSCFIGTMLINNPYRMNIPKELAVAVGLIRKKSVILEDPNGKSWKVGLRQDEKRRHGGRFLMTEGLSACFKKNNISQRDTVVFELVHARTGEMKLHIFRAEAGGKKPSVVLDPSDD